MPQRHFVTIRSKSFNDLIDLEMPGDEPLGGLLPDLLKVLNWPVSTEEEVYHYQLRSEDAVLGMDDTLVSAGIENFQVLWIDPPEEGQGESATQFRSLWQQVPVDGPSLVSAAGWVFVLGQPPQLIGRYDEGQPVDVDLTHLEGDTFVSSRRHAELLKEGNQYTLRPFKTTNGTLVNGARLEPGVAHVLKEGDRITFGFGGVELFFRTE